MNNLKSKVLLATLIVSTIIGSTAFMNNAETKVVIAGKNGIEKDAEFLIKASEIIMEEINLARLAQEKGRMSHVKELGKKMEDDHNKSLADLKILAKSKNISLPTTQTKEAEEEYNKLNDKSGNDFDKAYIDMMVDGHKEAIEIFVKASSECNDSDIKAWAISTLPALRTHLDHSTMCQKELDKM